MPEPGLIAVVGGESTGKTTLAHGLARALPAVLVPETLREWVAAQGRVPEAHEQAAVMQVHRLREVQGAEQAARSGLNWVVSDGSMLMTAVYSAIYYQDHSLMAEALAAAESAALVVWCGADPAWEPDPGQRDGIEWRDLAQDTIEQALADRPGVNWIRAEGSVSERVRTVLTALTA